jgi:hypothetical protein
MVGQPKKTRRNGGFFVSCARRAFGSVRKRGLPGAAGSFRARSAPCPQERREDVLDRAIAAFDVSIGNQMAFWM